MTYSDAPHGVLAELGRTVRLALPILVAQVALVMMNVTATKLAGDIGSDALAVAGLGNALFFSISVILTGIVSSVGVKVAESEGAGRPEQAAIFAHQGLRLGLLVALPGVAVLLGLPLLLAALNYRPDLLAGVAAYLGIIAFGLVPYIWVMVLRFVTAAIARPQAGTVIAIIGVMVQFGLGKLLLAEGWGLKGVAVGLAAGMWVMLGAFLLYVRLDPRCRRYSMLWQSGGGAGALRSLWKMGWPIGIAFAAETLLFSISSTMAGLFTQGELAAHAIANQSVVSTFMMAVAVAHATMVRVAHAVGQGRRDRARLIGLAGVGLGLVCMGCSATLFFTAGPWVVGRFIDLERPENLITLEFALPLLVTAGIFQLVDGVQAIGAAALRGLEDVRATMIIGVIAYWPIGLLTAWALAFPFGLRTQGLWIGLAVGLAAAALGMMARFLYLTSAKRLAAGRMPPAAV